MTTTTDPTRRPLTEAQEALVAEYRELTAEDASLADEIKPLAERRQAIKAEQTALLERLGKLLRGANNRTTSDGLWLNYVAKHHPAKTIEVKASTRTVQEKTTYKLTLIDPEDD